MKPFECVLKCANVTFAYVTTVLECAKYAYSLAGGRQCFVILGETAVSAEPCECSFDHPALGFGDEMARLRRSIAAKECSCPMANASYANMLLHPPTLARAALDVAK